MKLLQGIDITDSNMTSSDVPENDADEWDSASAPYALNDVVMVTTTANGASEATHKVYKSTASSNNADPTLGTTYTSGDDEVLWWTETGSTNRWKAFNDVLQDQTSQDDGFQYVITPVNVVTGVGLMNVNAGSVRIEVDDPTEGVIFEETFSMVAPISEPGWWPYFFEPVERKSSLYVDGIPPSTGAAFTVEFIGDGTVEAGIVDLGYSRKLGESLYGANYSIIDYSTRQTDADGRVTISQGAYRDVADVPVFVLDSAFSNTRRILAEYRSTPAMWVADENREGTILYGFFDRYDIMLSNPAGSDLTIRIEGLI